MKICFIILICFISGSSFTQPTIKVEVSADTIATGEMVEVTYTIENGEGKFDAPDFSGLPLISGPNTSTSFMIINGEKSSSQSYSYILRPMEESILEIPPGSYVENEVKQLIDGVKIIVLDKGKTQSSSAGAKAPSKVNREKRKF